MIAGTARLTCVGRWNSNTFHTVKQSLILNILSKHREIPFTKFSPKLLVSFFTCKSNSSKVFNCDSLTILFSRLNNRFCNSMINYGSGSLLLARKPFQQLTRVACVFALNRTTNLLPLLPIGINPVGRVFNAIRSNDNICETEIKLKNALVLLIFVLSLHQNISAMDRKEYLRQYHLKTYVPTGNKQGRPRELPNYDFSGIYQLKNTVNEKTYIGQAQNILNRFNDHRRNRNGHLLYRDCHLYRAIKKYGWQKFEISVLERVDDISLLNEREIFWINELNPAYNMKDGGDCARGWHHTEEAKRKMSETKSKQYLGKNNPFYGKTHSEKTKKKIAEASKNRKHSEETKLKMRAWYKPEMFYKRVGKFDVETGQLVCEYNSVKEASESVNVSQSNMSSHLGGRNKTCKGYVFKFI